MTDAELEITIKTHRGEDVFRHVIKNYNGKVPGPHQTPEALFKVIQELLKEEFGA